MNVSKGYFPILSLFFALSFTLINPPRSFAVNFDGGSPQDASQTQDHHQEQSSEQSRNDESKTTLADSVLKPFSAEINFLNSVIGYYQGTRQQSDNTGSPSFSINTYQNYVFPTIFTSNNRWTFRWSACYQNGYCSNYDTILAEQNGKIYLDINGDGSVLVPGTTSEVTPNSLVQFFNYNINSTTTRNVIIFDSLLGSTYTRSIIIRDNGEIVRELFYVLQKSSTYNQRHEAAPHTKMRF